MRRILASVALFVPVVAAVLGASRDAQAGPFLGAQVDLAAPVDLQGAKTPAYGVGGILGYRVGLGPVWIQPEGMGHYTIISGETGGEIHVPRIVGGARAGLGGVFQPSVYGHAGIGWVDVAGPKSGAAFDVGLNLDLGLIPMLTFGAHVGYNVVNPQIEFGSLSVKWVNFGLHAGVDF